MFQPHPDVELKNPTLKFQNPDPTIYSSSENSNSKKIVSFAKSESIHTLQSQQVQDIPTKTGKVSKKNHPGWFFVSGHRGAAPRFNHPHPGRYPPPEPDERPHFHGRDSPYETVVWPDRRSEWLRRWNPAHGWGGWCRDTFEMKTWLFCEIALFFVRDPYVMVFLLSSPTR